MCAKTKSRARVSQENNSSDNGDDTVGLARVGIDDLVRVGAEVEGELDLGLAGDVEARSKDAEGLEQDGIGAALDGYVVIFSSVIARSMKVP